MKPRRTRRLKRRRVRHRSTRQRGGSTSHTAILIEPRKSRQGALEFVTKNLLENLPANWCLILFTGPNNTSEVESFVKTLPSAQAKRVTVKNLHIKNLTESEYNKLMMSRKILDEIPTEMFLVVQVDSMICKGGSHILEKFLEYDYVGAPWKDRNAIGNGGFSLRRKSVMLKILNTCPTLNHNEDGFFSGGCEGVVPKKPSPSEAEEFSVETIFNGKQPFGIHKSWYHMPENSSKIEEKCLGYSTLRNLNTGQEGGQQHDTTLAILCWKSFKTLKNTLESYKANGLLKHVHTVIYFQERTPECEAIAKDYGITDVLGTAENIGILDAFMALIRHTTTPYFIFAECDFELVHGEDVVQKVLADAKKLMEEKDVQLVRLRDRKNPGKPLGSREIVPVSDAELPGHTFDQGYPYKIETLHFLEKPEEKFPGVFEIIHYNYPWYKCSSNHSTWSNNVFIAKTSFLKEKVLKLLEGLPKEGMDHKFSRLENFLLANLKDYTIAGGHGLFTHNRLDR